MGINLKVVKTKRDLKTFIKFPFKIYKNNPYWVPPLIRDELSTFNRKKNPAYKNADSKLFMAYKNGEPVGRIAGILSFIANEKYNSKNVRFGWFDSINDYEVAHALFNAVESWGKEQGMETITGPHGFTDLDNEGMVIYGFDQIVTIACFYNHEYYKDLTEKYGFKKDVDYVEFRSIVPKKGEIPEKLLRISERIKQRSQLKLIKFKKKKDLFKRAEELFQLLDESFEEIYGTVPLTQEQIEYYIKMYISFVDKEMVKAIANEKDEMIGFMIAMPNLSKAFQKAKGRLFPFGWYHIFKAIKTYEVIDFYLAGIRKKYRGQGLDILMVTEFTKTASERGFKFAESNLELEDNKKIQAQWKFFSPTLHRKRRIFKKTIDSKNDQSE